MLERPTYKVQINSTIGFFTEVALALSSIAFLGFCLWYLTDLPVRYNLDLSTAYYVNLPKWLLKIFAATMIMTVVAALLFSIRRNSDATLKIENDFVILEGKKKVFKVKLSELKKVVFVVKPATMNPYRIEFVYRNLKLVRVKLLSETDFDEIIKAIYEIAPKGLLIDTSPFETIEN